MLRGLLQAALFNSSGAGSIVQWSLLSFLSCRSRDFNGFQVEESGDNQNEFYGQAHTADQWPAAVHKTGKLKVEIITAKWGLGVVWQVLHFTGTCCLMSVLALQREGMRHCNLIEESICSESWCINLKSQTFPYNFLRNLQPGDWTNVSQLEAEWCLSCQLSPGGSQQAAVILVLWAQ